MEKENYMVDGKIFETLIEAREYEKYLRNKTGIFYCIVATHKQATHFCIMNGGKENV